MQTTAAVTSVAAACRQAPTSRRTESAAPSGRRLVAGQWSRSMARISTAPALRSRQPRPSASPASAMLVSRDDASGTEYPLVNRFWAGEEYRSLGAASLSKKWLFFFNSNVYALTCYVEAAKAAKELGVRYRGGFFETEQDFCDAIMDGAFGKAIQLTMLQDGLCEELADAIEDAISPRMRLMQQGKAMEDFLGFFRLRADAMVKGANVVLFFDQTGTLNMAVRAPVASGETEQPISGTVNWLSGVPEQSWANPALCRALLEAWLGEKTLVPACTPVFAAGAKALLESENIRRQTRKGGSG